MCGILGIVGPNVDSLASRQAFESALLTLQHRGPDGSGLELWDDAWFGHRRLSIIDIAGGKQPMKTPRGTAMISYNGEVFNYRAISAALGLSTRSRCDTEVVLLACHALGERALSQFRGMFAFAYYDQEPKRLILARDPLGIKPLYYARSDDAILFCSEIPPLRALLGNPAEVEACAIAQYLRYGFVPEPHTAFRQIRALLPGHYLVFAGGVERITRYWRPALGARAPRPREAEIQRSIESTVQGAVSDATVSDVPLASLLSGGIDSAVLAAAIRRKATYYHLRFGDAYDESRAARTTADHVGVDLRVVDGRIGAPDAVTRSLMQQVGQPFADTSLFACDRVFRTIARTHKVCLSGDGGDEVFCGYSLRRAIALDAIIGPALARGGAVARRVARTALLPVLRRYVRLTGLGIEPILRAELRDDDPYWDAIRRDVDWALHETDDIVNVVSYVLLTRTLPNDMLVKLDRSSMCHSVEVRVPLLDHKVVEAGLALPGPMKQTLRRTKIPLKRFLARRGFRADFLSSPKKGFGPVPQRWEDSFAVAPHPGLLDQVFRPGRGMQIRSSIYARLLSAWHASLVTSRPEA